ncbi:hypothetical protein ABIC22_000012 [Paenibacillus sp. PvP094]
MITRATRKAPPVPIASPDQPEKCKGCIWGEWAGTKQVCKIPRCWKEDEGCTVGSFGVVKMWKQ